MATAVWTTLETYDIQDKVCKISYDHRLIKNELTLIQDHRNNDG
jgi:hypothetical protein